jgi:Asp-tRNA(Asn)/Glu-tRNA(Gln) amidotransferase A subunit family amidase
LITAASLSQTAKALRTSQLDLQIYLNSVLARIEEIDPQLQALVPEPDRRRRVMQEAIALQERYPSVEARPALFGIPLGVKDVFRADGLPTRAGSALSSHLFDAPESACVRMLKRHGAIVIGKTVTTEFAFMAPGPTRNPHNPAHTPGGSSSGSAAGVAAGLFPLATGTQTVGSTIRPAAYCGIVGYKASYGRIDSSGVIYFAPSLDHVGLFTQEVSGMQLVASLLCRNWHDAIMDERDRDRTARDEASLPVLAVPEGLYLQQASESALSAFKRQIAQLKAAGYTVMHTSALDNIVDIAHSHRALMAYELAEQHAAWFEEYESLYRPQTANLIREGQGVSSQTVDDAREMQLAVRDELGARLAALSASIWITPAATGTAPAGLESTGDSAMNAPWTFAGLPTITVPAGQDKGLPLGLQCSASFWNDEKLLTWAKGIEQVLRV